MSNSIVYGYAPYELKPGPDFSAGSDSSGKYTGSQTFTCRKFDFSSSVIQIALRRGTKANDIYPALGSEWGFMRISSVRHEHQPGGITKIFVEYEGVASDSFEFGDDGKEVSYSFNGNLTERSMLSHPNFIKLTSEVQEAIAALLNGTGRKIKDDPVTVVDNYNGKEIGVISGGDEFKWYTMIIINKEETYQVSAGEWTLTKNNTGGLTGLSSLGKIDTPAGRPPTFSGRNWLLSGATQSTSKSGDSTIKTWSKTWQLSPPDEEWKQEVYG